MTLDEMTSVVSAVAGVDGGCSTCRSYVLKRIESLFPRFAVGVSTGAFKVTDCQTGEARGFLVDLPEPDDNEEVWTVEDMYPVWRAETQ
jgi:hypothetical protein